MKFTIGQKVRYKPGFGTYGYEGSVGADGRVAGVVVGYTPRLRVRIETRCDRGAVTRAVEEQSLILDEAVS